MSYKTVVSVIEIITHHCYQDYIENVYISLDPSKAVWRSESYIMKVIILDM